MQDVAQGGRTVLFVSHNMAAVLQLCNRGVLLVGGEIIDVADISRIVKKYRDALPMSEIDIASLKREGCGGLRIEFVRTESKGFRPHLPKRFTVSVVPDGSVCASGFVVLEFMNQRNEIVTRCDSRLHGFNIGPEGGIVHFEMRTPWLNPGNYSIRASIDSGAGFIDRVDGICRFSVESFLPYSHSCSEDAYLKALTLSDFELRFDSSVHAP